VSQKVFLRELDRVLIDTFWAVGMADDAVYTEPGGGFARPCQVLVDHDVRDYGEEAAQVGTAYTLITFQRSQVTPRRGGSVVVGAIGDTQRFILDAEVKRDESMSRWVVTRA
jgi:hypothetical protein